MLQKQSRKMSILNSVPDCFTFLDHRDYTCHLYKNIGSDHENESNALLTKLFCINSHNKEPNSRKRRHDSGEFLCETNKIKAMYKNLLKQLPQTLIELLKNKYNIKEISTVRDLAKELFEATVFEHHGISGGNTSQQALKCKIKDNFFLIPPKSRFLCGCVKEQCLKLVGNKYDLLIADPPWWNKYVRRLKSANYKLSYSMMYNEDIASIPVKELLAENCLVAVWCTNSPSNIAAVKELIFPKWGVQYVATWYWLKTTVDLKPLCPFGVGSQKQPYERLMLGKVGDVTVPKCHLIASVPSALHSHKPPLLDVLSQYVMSEEPQTLELFARYLLPNTTSVGYEPLKWQHEVLYEKVS